ncbi:MAG: hypothetical protein KDD53_09985, partial [Bdellovibrionales bacterium]|nr:hypothetical protein [Bdellovibrionales bacterium]
VGGGDGTFSAVLRHCQGVSTPVALLALGTGNDLARELKVPIKQAGSDIKSFFKWVDQAHQVHLQIWKIKFGEQSIESEFFTNYVSFGLDASIVQAYDYIRDHPNYRLYNLGKWGNRIAFAKATLAKFGHEKVIVKSLTELDSGKLIPLDTVRTLSLSNIRSVAGLGVSNQLSDPFDQKIELLATCSLFEMLQYLSPWKLPWAHPKVMGSAGGWEIEFNSPPAVQIDGEGRPDICSNKYVILPGQKVTILSTLPEET